MSRSKPVWSRWGMAVLVLTATRCTVDTEGKQLFEPGPEADGDLDGAGGAARGGTESGVEMADGRGADVSVDAATSEAESDAPVDVTANEVDASAADAADANELDADADTTDTADANGTVDDADAAAADAADADLADRADAKAADATADAHEAREAAAEAAPRDASLLDVAADAEESRAADAHPDESHRDASVDGDAAAFDGCADPSAEVCDGVDNDCNGDIDEDGVCPDGCIGVAKASRGYMFCYAGSLVKTWPDAEADCAARGMHLVRIDDGVENENLIAMVWERGVATVWIGANDRATKGVWRWTDGDAFWIGDGATGVPAGQAYYDWAPLQPNGNDPNGEDCVALDMMGAAWGWNDLNCTTLKRRYLCEHD